MTDTLSRDKLGELKPIFYPRAMAVVGASTNEQKMGSRWLRGLVDSPFKGEVYAVNPHGGEVFGLKIHPDLQSIPGPLDLVIVCIPRELVLDLMDDCAAKGIKAVQFFTAGFRETGDPKWIAVEEEMVRKARRGGFRIIGPNCFGIYCPEGGVPYGPWIPVGKTGSIGYVSQSGGHGGKMLEIGLTRGMSFSKVVSMGNGSELGTAELMEYLAVDPKTEIIGLYLEGPLDSRQLLDKIRACSRSKPVVVWKGGRTKAGSRAAASHTGAMAASPEIWSGALRQAGAIEVQGLEELADTLLLLQTVGRLKKTGVGIICGLTDGGGGEAVLTADACAALGVAVPLLTERTRQGLLDIVGSVGSILHNPVDISQRSGNIEAFRQVTELVIADPRIAILVVYENADILSKFLDRAAVKELNGIIIDFCHRQNKPVVVVLPPGSMEMERLEIEHRLAEAGIPVYTTMDRAAKAIANVNRYFRLHTRADEPLNKR